MKERGFTLVELLVALFILGLIAAAAAVSLKGVSEARRGVAQTASGISDLMSARALIRSDLAQIAMRPTRGSDGLLRSFLFDGRHEADAEGLLMAFARAGRSNLGAYAQHGSVVYVEYRLEKGDLLRRVHPVPDGGAAGASEVRLIAGAGPVSLRYFDGRAWHESWRTPAQGSTPLPRAVAIAFRAGDLDVEHLFLTGGRS
ncbi:MAG: type II secretion system minor pseudopilin GspJ [Rhodothalassiaceae bacterium]